MSTGLTRIRRRGWSLVAVAVLLAALPAASGCARPKTHESAVAGLVAQADAAPTPHLDWVECAEPELRGSDCATAAVPLDYARPDGETITLALVRQPASDSAHRIGTLFAGAGGPGESGVESAAHGRLFPGAVSRRFDVVTFDQRGIGRSAPVRCFADDEARRRFWTTVTLPPVTPEQRVAAERASAELAEGCARYSAALLPHLTTVDAARDLDLLRRAVGDTRLTYQGSSYASYLGEVYGALFGDRVRALQLSALFDPDAYTLDSAEAVHDTAVGAEEVLGEFLRLCAAAGKTKCAFAAAPVDAEPRSAVTTDSNTVRTRDDALLERLRQAPITVGTGEGAVPVSYGEAIRAHALLLYDQEAGWPALARLLSELERGSAGNADAVRRILATGATDFDFLDSYTAISCADNSFPREPGLWPRMASEFAATAPTYSAFWLYLRQSCASWPAPAQGYPQRYAGPWMFSADKPALLVNNRFDPVTPLLFAQRAQQAMVNARLVVVSDGYGHEPSDECTIGLREHYLVDLRLPAPGATCATDRQPFTG